MVILSGKTFRCGITYMPLSSRGFESFNDGSWHFNVFGIEVWRHRKENQSVAERGAW